MPVSTRMLGKSILVEPFHCSSDVFGTNNFQLTTHPFDLTGFHVTFKSPFYTEIVDLLF